MGVTLQFFGMIMPFGCALMGFATAVSAQTSWYLVVPLLFVGFEMDIFEAVVLSVLLDLCNGATLSVFNGYHGHIDWAYGTAFGVLTAVAAVPPALLLRSIIAHEQDFVKFTAAFIPAIMSIAFLVKGVKLLRLEKREKLAAARRATFAASSSSSSSRPVSRAGSVTMKAAESPSFPVTTSSSSDFGGPEAALHHHHQLHHEHQADLEDGFVHSPEDYVDEEGMAHGDEDPLFDTTTTSSPHDQAGSHEASLQHHHHHEPQLLLQQPHSPTTGPSSPTSAATGNHHHSQSWQAPEPEGDHHHHHHPGSPSLRWPQRKQHREGFIRLSSDHHHHHSDRDDDGFGYDAHLEVVATAEGDEEEDGRELRALKTGSEVDLAKSRRKGRARLTPFAASTRLLSTRPTFKFKRLAIPFRGVLSMTIIGHIFLGLFMGTLLLSLAFLAFPPLNLSLSLSFHFVCQK